MSITQGGKTVKYMFTAVPENLQGIEEITEDMVGTSGYTFTSERIELLASMTIPANRVTVDYVFIYNDQGELVKYTMDKYEAGVHTQGLTLVLRATEEDEEVVEP